MSYVSPDGKVFLSFLMKRLPFYFFRYLEGFYESSFFWEVDVNKGVIVLIIVVCVLILVLML